MHSITSFLDFQTLKLIHFQKNFQGGQGRGKGGRMLPLPPERNPGSIKNINSINAIFGMLSLLAYTVHIKSLNFHFIIMT